MFNAGFYTIGIIMVSWAVFSFFFEKILFWNVLNKNFNEVLKNDATHFDNKGELLESQKDDPQGDLNEEIELKAFSPPRNYINLN